MHSANSTEMLHLQIIVSCKVDYVTKLSETTFAFCLL